MSRRLLARALVALAAPALLVPALSSAAVADTGASVPSVENVAVVYPYLTGGSAYTTTDELRGIKKNCKRGKAIKGASITSASYMQAETAFLTGTAEAPWVGVAAMEFRTPADVVKYLRRGSKGSRCAIGATGDGVEVKMTKFPVELGDQSQGYTMTLTFAGTTYTGQYVQVREGRYLVVVSVDTNNDAVASVEQAVALARVAVEAL